MSSIFSACNCSIHYLGRVQRSGWMRFFPWMRLYQCANCKKLQLLPQKEVDRAKAAYGSRVTNGKGGRDATPSTTAPRA